MAWNPSPEVATCRDAARKHNADRVIMLYTTKDGLVRMASYGETKALCAKTGKIGDKMFDAFMCALTEDALDAQKGGA